MTDSALGKRGTGSSWTSGLLPALRPFWRTGAVTLVFIALAQALALSRGEALSASILGYLRLLAIFAPFIFALWLVARFAHMVVRTRPASPARAFAAEIRELLLNPERWKTGVPFLTIIFLLTISYTYFKSHIPDLQPFAWDRTFHDLDVWLHGGRQPWQWLQPLLGHAPVTFTINFVYNLWFVIMIGTWLWLGLTRAPDAARQRYLMAFVLTWAVGGGLLAILLSSAGPCYFGRLTGGPDPYAPLMDYLAGVDASGWPVWAISTQDMLWNSYTGAEGVSGISAMPSMHVATATLLLPLTWRRRGWARWLAIAFFACILIGSVHLGWHYAVDGYLGIVIAAAAWYTAGILLGPWDDARADASSRA